MGEALAVPTATDDPEVDETLAMRWSVGRVLGVLTMVLIAVFWAAVFAGIFKRDNFDRLDDRAFVARTEARCDTLLEDLAVSGPDLKPRHLAASGDPLTMAPHGAFVNGGRPWRWERREDRRATPLRRAHAPRCGHPW